MTVDDTQRLRNELLIDRAIDTQLNALVRLANQTVATLSPQTRLEENQLRNLLNVAQKEPSVEVILSFIRYQIGRSSTVWGTGQNDFGHRVIADIRTGIQQAADTIRIGLKSTQTPIDADALYIRLVRLYLGYLNRAFVFFKKSENKPAAATQLTQVAQLSTQDAPKEAA